MKKWLNKLPDVLRRLGGKAVEELLTIREKLLVFLSFLGRAVGFVAKHTWALTVFVGGFIGVWLMQKVKKIDISFFHYPRRS